MVASKKSEVINDIFLRLELIETLGSVSFG